MRSGAREIGGPRRPNAGPTGALPFLALPLFSFITTTPFADLNGASHADPQAGDSNIVNQIAALQKRVEKWRRIIGHRALRFVSRVATRPDRGAH